MQLTEALAKAIELLPESSPELRTGLIATLQREYANLATQARAIESQAAEIQQALIQLRNGDEQPGLDLDAELDRRGVTKHEGLYAKVRRVNKKHKAAGPRLPKPSRLDIMAWAKAHDGITVHEFVEAHKGKFDMSNGYVSVLCSGCAKQGLLRRGGPGQYVITTKGKEWQ